jgi:SAM-dependent methyltransferase
VNYYARRAQEYERIYLKPERQNDLQRLRDFVERAFAGAHVFEVACGTGYWTEIIARTAATIVATDINEEVLAVARAKLIDPRRVTFRKEDAFALPVLAQRFSAGFSGFWWSHIPKANLRPFLEGFHRVLSPGARVVFMDNIYVEGSSTPLIVHWPKGIAARGELRHDIGHVIDFAPTLLDLAGAQPESRPAGAPPFPGRSLVPAFAKDGARQTRHPIEVFFHHEDNRALRLDDWKIVSASIDGGAWCLYNLATDRAESTNLAGQYPDRVREMSVHWQNLEDEFHRQASPTNSNATRR